MTLGHSFLISGTDDIEHGPPVFVHISEPHPYPVPSIPSAHQSPRPADKVNPTESARLSSIMTNLYSSYETDYQMSTIPVIKVNGEDLEEGEIVEGYVALT